MDNFYEILDLHTVGELKTRLPLLISEKKPTRKADIIKLIMDDCSKNHEDYWDKLSFLEKKVLEEVIHQENREHFNQFSPVRFQAKYGKLPEYFAPRSYCYKTNRIKEAAISYLSLFFYHYNIPDNFCQWMKTYVPKPEKTSIDTVDESELPTQIHIELHEYQKRRGLSGEFPVHTRLMEDIASKDLDSMLRFVETGKCTVSDKTSRATAATTRKLDGLLLGGDYYHPDEIWDLHKYEGSTLLPMRSFAWPLLLQASGLAKRVGKKLQLTAKGKKALTLPYHETAKLLYQRWRNKRLLDEFSRIDTIKGQASKGRVMSAVVERRNKIENILLECPVNEWMPIDSLFQYIKAKGSELKVCLNDWKLYLSDRDYGTLGHGGNFNILEGRYILVYFFEYLATMGLLDIAYTLPYLAREDDLRDMWGIDELYHLSRYDGLRYFRINPLGAYCLGLSDHYEPRIIEKPALLEINDNLQISLLREAEPAESMMLDRYAEQLPAKQWQLSEAKILEAMGNSFSADNFQQFLQESVASEANGELSKSVQAFFSTAAEREHALHDQGAARLLRCYNETFAKVLTTNAATQKYCMQVEDRVIVVADKNKQKFAKGLRKLGYIYPQEIG